WAMSSDSSWCRRSNAPQATRRLQGSCSASTETRSGTVSKNSAEDLAAINPAHYLELRPRRHSLRSRHWTAHRQHRARCCSDDRLGDTAQQHMSDAGAAVRTHHDEIDA